MTIEPPQTPSLLEQRALRLMERIKKRCRYMQIQARKADEAFFWRNREAGPPKASASRSTAKAVSEAPAEPLDLRTLARYVHQWKALLPQDPALRAALVHLLSNQYELQEGQYPQLLDALGFGEQSVHEAYRLAYAQPIEAAFVLRSGVHDVTQAIGLSTPGTGTGQPENTASASANAARGEAARAAAAAQAASAEASVLSGTVDEAVLRDIDACFEWVHLPGGEMLYRQGDQVDSLYILVSGRLRKVICRSNDQEDVIAELCRGEMVGDVSLLTGADHRATSVYALRDSELLCLRQEDLTRLAEKHPDLVLRLTRLLAQRLRMKTIGAPRKANTLATFAVVPLKRRDGSKKNFSTFTHGFADALGIYGSVLYLNSQQIDGIFGEGMAQIGQGDAEGGWLSAWLNEQESHYRFIVYEADDQFTPWTQRCIRQADRILMVTKAGADPALGEIESEISGMQVKASRELVLLHPPETRRPSGTQRWLSPGRFDGHHHVRLASPAHLARLARRLTGNALGLVLGGGGARGLAHVGVLRALQEAGLDIDLVGGTSIGSLIAGLFALGMDDRQIAQLAEKFSSPYKLYDLTFPVVSFFKTEKMTQLLQDLFEDTRIEDLWMPYFCVSTNLTRAVPMIHTRGSLWEAIRASSAIPGVFAPLLHEGELLVDGAVLNNLPVDVMRDQSEGGPIVAVNVMPAVDLLMNYDFGPSISGWKVLLNRLNPLSENFPAPLIFENLVRVISINDVHQAREKLELADLYIGPDVANFSILDFRAHKQVIQIGYQQAQADIAAWQASHPNEATTSQPSLTHQLTQALDQLDVLLQEEVPPGEVVELPVGLVKSL